ncbi:MAG: peptidoglycan editing factor PgeF [Stellaceae bacterium]
MIRLDTLDAPGIAHGFFTRDGGVSQGIYASLNCGWGSGDEPDAVAENRARAASSLGVAPDALATNNQVHGVTVVAVEGAPRRGERPKADGMVTRRRGVALGILTADCAPVLFADAEAGVIGAAHAGWRGALGGVLDATVRAMIASGADAKRIRAGFGPAIAAASYEVGPEFPAPFLAQDSSQARFFVTLPNGKFRFDLPGYVRNRLDGLGLAAVAGTGGDTAAEPERFFSYRRSRLAGEPDYGRLLSAIALL